LWFCPSALAMIAQASRRPAALRATTPLAAERPAVSTRNPQGKPSRADRDWPGLVRIVICSRPVPMRAKAA
jgi:hypothetical protein